MRAVQSKQPKHGVIQENNKKIRQWVIYRNSQAIVIKSGNWQYFACLANIAMNGVKQEIDAEEADEVFFFSRGTFLVFMDYEFQWIIVAFGD